MIREGGPARRAMALVASVLAGFSLVNVATTFLPGPPVFGTGPTLALVLVTLPLFAGVLVWVVRGSGGTRPANEQLWRQWRGLPTVARRSLGGLVLLLWACAIAAFVAGPDGQPHEDDGRYYLNNHGTETDITQEEYERALQLSIRTFAAGDAILLVVAATTLWCYRPPPR